MSSIPKTIFRPVDNTEYFCDFCKKEGTDTIVKNNLGVNGKCSICGRDICQNHKVIDYTNYNLNYPNVWCLECHSIGLPYIEEIAKFKKELLSTEQKLLREWHQKAKENSKRIKS